MICGVSGFIGRKLGRLDDCSQSFNRSNGGKGHTDTDLGRIEGFVSALSNLTYRIPMNLPYQW